MPLVAVTPSALAREAELAQTGPSPLSAAFVEGTSARESWRGASPR